MKDLTQGNPQKVLWQLSLPMFISVIFQQMYSIADSAIAGQYAGEDGLAAVGASYPITMIFLAIGFGINIGCSVVISQLFGGKLYAKMKTAVSTTIIVSLIMSLLMTLFGLIASSYLLKLINTPENIFKDSLVYFNIYIAGLVFLFIYNVTTGIFTSLGDSRTPLYFLIASSIGNVILDYLFVAVFDWGVAGIAWATFIAQGLAGLLAFIYLLKRLKLIKTKKFSYFSFHMLKKIAHIAIPSILQQSFISIGNSMVQVLINGYGSSVIAGFTAGVKLNTFVLTSLATFSNGVSSFSAQNYGARKIDRVKKSFYCGMKMSMTLAIPLFLVCFFGAKYIIRIFLDDVSGEAMSTAVLYLRILSPFYIVVNTKLVCDAILRGTALMKEFMVSTFVDLIIRVALAFWFSARFGINGLFWSWPIGWIIGTILAYMYFKKAKWQKENFIKSARKN